MKQFNEMLDLYCYKYLDPNSHEQIVDLYKTVGFEKTRKILETKLIQRSLSGNDGAVPFNYYLPNLPKRIKTFLWSGFLIENANDQAENQIDDDMSASDKRFTNNLLDKCPFNLFKEDQNGEGLIKELYDYEDKYIYSVIYDTALDLLKKRCTKDSFILADRIGSRCIMYECCIKKTEKNLIKIRYTCSRNKCFVPTFLDWLDLASVSSSPLIENILNKRHTEQSIANLEADVRLKDLRINMLLNNIRTNEELSTSKLAHVYHRHFGFVSMLDTKQNNTKANTKVTYVVPRDFCRYYYDNIESKKITSSNIFICNKGNTLVTAYPIEIIMRYCAFVDIVNKKKVDVLPKNKYEFGFSIGHQLTKTDIFPDQQYCQWESTDVRGSDTIDELIFMIVLLAIEMKNNRLIEILLCNVGRTRCTKVNFEKACIQFSTININLFIKRMHEKIIYDVFSSIIDFANVEIEKFYNRSASRICLLARRMDLFDKFVHYD